MADNPIMSTSGDPRDHRQTKYDLNRVDFDWVEKSTDKKELLKAYAALQEDGGYPQLQQAVGEKICTLDPAFRRKFEGNRASLEEEQFVAQDIQNFLNDIQKLDSKLSGDGKQQSDSQSIFSSSAQNKQERAEFAEQIERQKLAEHERLKGNECMKSKDYNDAIDCYTKSITLFPTDPATYSNRALAHLYLKEYARTIDDSNEALKLNPDFLKAYHRRGKAYVAVNKLEMAIRDFQFILEKEPNNKDAMQEIKQARNKLEGKVQKKGPSSTVNGGGQAKVEAVQEKTEAQKKQENKFVRVAIQEESDEEEDTPQPDAQIKESNQQPVTTTKSDLLVEQKNQSSNDSDKENKPTPSTHNIEVLQSQENDSWWKASENQYDEFKLKDDKKAKVEEQKQQVVKQEEEKPKVEEIKDQPVKEATKSDVKAEFKRIQIVEDDEDEDDEDEKEEVKVQQVEQKKQSPVKQQPSSQENKVSEERALERTKLDKLLKEIEAITSKASQSHDKGMYEEAITFFQQADAIITKNLSKYTHLKKDLIEKEATIYNNIAACYKQGQHHRQEIEYSSKVIERAPYISNLTILAKAYQRRSYAYEHMEKYQEAKDDMTRVRELQPSNQQASQALNRINKALQEIAKNKTNVDIGSIETKLGKLKDSGNAKYQAQDFRQAIQHFTEAIDLFLKHNPTTPALLKDKDIKLKITQIFTNRSLAYHQLNDQSNAFADANYVLSNLDTFNQKALFRRAIAYKHQNNYELAVRDLQTIMKQEPANKKDIQAELDTCLKKFVEQQKEKKAEEANKKQDLQKSGVKIQDISNAQNTSTVQTDVQKEEEEEEVKEVEKKPQAKKMKNLQQDVIDKAAELATQKTAQNLTKQVPKTAAGLETDYNSLKKDLPSFYQYFKNIPLELLEQFYKSVEIPAEIFAAMMKVTKDYGVKDDIQYSAKLLKSLSKASSFDMTLMFMDSKEKNDLKEIIKVIKSDSQMQKEAIVKELDTIYNF